MRDSYYAALPAPAHFATTFSEQVEAHFAQHFSQHPTGEINFTKTPDLRLRKHQQTGLGFINAATLAWQAKRNALLLRTALSDAEFAQFGLQVAKRDQDTLSAMFYIDECTARDKAEALFSLMEHALATRQHATRG